MIYERLSQPLASRAVWLQRVRQSALLALGFIAVPLTAGILGYRFIAGLPWIDAVLEASMILGGMGEVATMPGTAAKLFASLYALVSGVFILASSSVLLAPWLHRLLHHMHTPVGPRD